MIQLAVGKPQEKFELSHRWPAPPPRHPGGADLENLAGSCGAGGTARRARKPPGSQQCWRSAAVASSRRPAGPPAPASEGAPAAPQLGEAAALGRAGHLRGCVRARQGGA